MFWNRKARLIRLYNEQHRKIRVNRILAMTEEEINEDFFDIILHGSPNRW